MKIRPENTLKDYTFLDPCLSFVKDEVLRIKFLYSTTVVVLMCKGHTRVNIYKIKINIIYVLSTGINTPFTLQKYVHNLHITSD